MRMMLAHAILMLSTTRTQALSTEYLGALGPGGQCRTASQTLLRLPTDPDPEALMVALPSL